MSVTVVNDWRFLKNADMEEGMSAIREYMDFLSISEPELEQSLWLKTVEDPQRHFHIATYKSQEALDRQKQSDGTKRFVNRLYKLIDPDSVALPHGPVVANTLVQEKLNNKDMDKRKQMIEVIDEFVHEYKNNHNPNIVDKLVAEDCKVHIPLPGLPQGREGMRVNGKMVCSAFPDVHVEREFFVIEGDIFVERAKAKATHQGELMGVVPTGNEVSWTELHAYRVQNGQIAEVWTEADFMGIMVQIGAVAMPGA